MSKKMLIDATHAEETRVALLNETGTLVDFEFNSSTKETVKGNIYLAKIARVEPSLQAAFVDYGGNRHGFLAFGEIHPDYFRIPVADRESLEKEMADSEAFEPSLEDSSLSAETNASVVADSSNPSEEASSFDMPVSTLGGDLPALEDEDEDEPGTRRPSLHRRYKIQEVIHKNQIILVQVAKEERGGKGAALSTYLSLAGRYCVLMPNSPRSGGISRKIANPKDRKRLREILDSFKIPDGMGLIVRTAGKDRSRIELRRDAQYLMRLWDNIRDVTMKSEAPAIIHREDNIIKRSIRDLYTKEIDEVIVDGDEGYKIAKDFMKTLMPSHGKRVQRFKMDRLPLFHQYGVEGQIDAMHEPEVRLPSGGSIVIHPTEALVSIDINSGKSTKERHIEETATKTNLEAATEIARQVRLRDLAGLIVIDFIDMDEPRHIASVERRVREAFKDDRARIQMGRISPFGLLEMSRQRLAPSILERSAAPCSHCHSTGYVRSTESYSLHVLRLLEEEGFKEHALNLRIEAPNEVILYIMNQKRLILTDIETRHGIHVIFEPSHASTCTLTVLTTKQPPEEEIPFIKPAVEVTPLAAEESSPQKQGPRAPRQNPRQHKKVSSKEGSATADKNDSPDTPKSLPKEVKEKSSSPKRNESDVLQPTDATEEAQSFPNADAGQDPNALQKKRRPRRRSGRRMRRPKADDAKEAAPSSIPLELNPMDAFNRLVTPISIDLRDDLLTPQAGPLMTPLAKTEEKKASTETGEKPKKKPKNWWRKLLDS